MRKPILAFIGFMLVVTVILPAVIVRGCDFTPPSSAGVDTTGTDGDAGLTLSVWVASEQRLRTMALEEYVRGVVAAEMPADFEPAALAAQSLVARTYAVGRLVSQGGKGCVLHAGADVCTDPTHCQGWASEAELRQTWGYFGFYSRWAKITAAVKSTADQIITSQGLPIDPAYHSTCGGHTENSEDVWSAKVSYLRGVVCETDGDSPRLSETKEFTLKQLQDALGAEAGALTAMRQGDAKLFQITSLTPNGRVRELRVGDRALTGAEFRTALGLRSTKMALSWSNGGLKVVTTGYGHGVGLCQYGSNGLAKLGLGFADIIAHYYTGVEIAPILDK